MNKLPDTIDVGPALKKLAEKYPTEDCYVQAFSSPKWGDIGHSFFACLGDTETVASFGATPMEAVDQVIELAGPRDPLAKIRAKIDKASLDLANAKEALRLEEEKLNEQHGTIVLTNGPS